MEILGNKGIKRIILEFATGVALLTATVVLDLLTGYELAFSLFYLAPISFFTWFLGGGWGIAASLVSALALFMADKISGHHYLQPFIPFLNAGIRFSLFALASLLLSALKKTMEREKELASTDFLTSAANGRRFFELLQLEFDRLQRYGRPFTLVYMDLDNFKMVNDQFGHPEGDRALRAIVRFAGENLRKVDVVARLGGDELALLLPEINEESARAVLVKLQKGLIAEMKRNNWPVTFSIGAVTCEGAAPATPADLVKLSDSLMYSVKRSGKNGIASMTYTGDNP